MSVLKLFFVHPRINGNKLSTMEEQFDVLLKKRMNDFIDSFHKK